MADETVTSGPDVVSQVSVNEPQTDTVGDDAGEAASPEPLDPAYVSRAAEWNLADEDLRAVPRTTVEKILAAADRRFIDMHRQPPPPSNYGQGNYGYTPPANSYAPPPAAAAPPNFGPPAEPQFTPFQFKFDGEADADSPIAKQLVGYNEHVAKQFEQLHGHYRQQIQGVHQYIAQQQAVQDWGIVDRYIDSLGSEWSGVFGKGSSLDFDQRSQEFAKRDELRTAAIAMMQGHQQSTGRRMPAQEALRRAQYALFADKVSTIERAKAEAQRKQLASSAAVPPKTAGAAPQPGGIRARAAATVRAMRSA